MLGCPQPGLAGEILWLGQAGAALGLVPSPQPRLQELGLLGLPKGHQSRRGGDAWLGWGRRDP